MVIKFSNEEKTFSECPNCGRLREEGTGECIFCGHTFEEEKDRNNHSSNGIKVPVPVIKGGSAGGVILILLFPFVLGAIIIGISLALSSVWLCMFGLGSIVIGTFLFLYALMYILFSF